MQDPEAYRRVAQLISGYWTTQSVYVAAKLGLADLLRDAPQTAEQLAEATGTHAPSLFRLLRALASLGVFAADNQGRFSLTPMAECLRSDSPFSQRGLAIMTGEEHFDAWGQLLYSVQTGQKAFDKIFKQPIFDYLAAHPDKAAVFDEAMVGVHGFETGAMLDTYDFAGIRTLMDIGGGNGSVLKATLTRHPGLSGILFDLPNVIERAKKSLAEAGLADRCQTVPGDFFTSVPGGADAYFMRHIIHDWEDEKAIRILRNIRRVAAPQAKLLLVESVIPEGNEPFVPKLLDLTMLVIPGGQERTEQQYRELLAAGGFSLSRIVPTGSDVSVIEGTPS